MRAYDEAPLSGVHDKVNTRSWARNHKHGPQLRYMRCVHCSLWKSGKSELAPLIQAGKFILSELQKERRRYWCKKQALLLD